MPAFYTPQDYMNLARYQAFHPNAFGTYGYADQTQQNPTPNLSQLGALAQLAGRPNFDPEGGNSPANPPGQMESTGAWRGIMGQNPPPGFLGLKGMPGLAGLAGMLAKGQQPPPGYLPAALIGTIAGQGFGTPIGVLGTLLNAIGFKGSLDPHAPPGPSSALSGSGGSGGAGGGPGDTPAGAMAGSDPASASPGGPGMSGGVAGPGGMGAGPGGLGGGPDNGAPTGNYDGTDPAEASGVGTGLGNSPTGAIGISGGNQGLSAAQVDASFAGDPAAQAALAASLAAMNQAPTTQFAAPTDIADPGINMAGFADYAGYGSAFGGAQDMGGVGNISGPDMGMGLGQVSGNDVAGYGSAFGGVDGMGGMGGDGSGGDSGSSGGSDSGSSGGSGSNSGDGADSGASGGGGMGGRTGGHVRLYANGGPVEMPGGLDPRVAWLLQQLAAQQAPGLAHLRQAEALRRALLQGAAG